MATVTLTPSTASKGSSPQHYPTSPKRPLSPNKSLQCSLCLQCYQDARLLPCLHTFCADCLENSCLQHSKDCPSVYCPVCMEETELTSKGIDGLPRNLYVKHLLDLQHVPGQGQRKCDLCTEYEVASSFCQVCGYSLCELCSQAHNRQRKTSKHDLIPVESLPPSLQLNSLLHNVSKPKHQRTPHCTVHGDHQLCIFCVSCNIPVCQRCALAEHCGHTFTPLDNITNQQEEILRNLSTRTKPFIVSLNDSVRNIEFMTKSVQDRAQTVAAEICDDIDERMKALQEHKRFLLGQLEAIKTHKLNTLGHQLEEVEKLFNSASSLGNLASTALREGNSTAMFSTSQPVIAELESLVSSNHDLTPQEDDYIQYNPTSIAGNIRGVEVLGTLDSRGPSAAHSIAEGEGLFEARQGQVATFKVAVNDRYKQRRTVGSDMVESKVEFNSAVLNTSIKKLGKGISEFSYVPETVGEHRISVFIQGKHVRSSPFIVNVLPLRSKHTGTFHCCSWCSSKGKKHVRCGCGSRMPGGYSGCGHGHPGHPGRKHWSCCGNMTEKSVCS